MPPFFIHDIDPVLFQIGSFQVRYYGVFFSVAVLTGFYLLEFLSGKHKNPRAVFGAFAEQIGVQTLIGRCYNYFLFGTLLGLRLGHVLFYNPEYYWQDLWAVFRIWEGGVSSHGAVGGGFWELFILVGNIRRESTPFWTCIALPYWLRRFSFAWLILLMLRL